MTNGVPGRTVVEEVVEVPDAVEAEEAGGGAFHLDAMAVGEEEGGVAGAELGDGGGVFAGQGAVNVERGAFEGVEIIVSVEVSGALEVVELGGSGVPFGGGSSDVKIDGDLILGQQAGFIGDLVCRFVSWQV